MTKLLVSMLHKALMFLWAKHHPHSSIHPHLKKEISFPLFENHLALCTTQPCSLGVNPIEISFVYKYVMIGASSCKSKAPSHFDSISTSQESPILISICILKTPQQGTL